MYLNIFSKRLNFIVESKTPVHSVAYAGDGAVQADHFSSVLNVFPPQHNPRLYQTNRQAKNRGNGYIKKETLNKIHRIKINTN
jgi:hypothetical protein